MLFYNNLRNPELIIIKFNNLDRVHEGANNVLYVGYIRVNYLVQHQQSFCTSDLAGKHIASVWLNICGSSFLILAIRLYLFDSLLILADNGFVQFVFEIT